MEEDEVSFIKQLDMNKYENIKKIKILVIGEKGVGKTTIIQNFTDIDSI